MNAEKDPLFVEDGYDGTESYGDAMKKLAEEGFGEATREAVRRKFVECKGRNGYTPQEMGIREAVRTGYSQGQILIGFHRLRDQTKVLEILKYHGFRKWFWKDGRQFIRETIVGSDDAFFFLHCECCLHGVWKGEDRCWDMGGSLRDWQWFHDSDILIKIDAAVDLFCSLLEGVQAG